MKSDVFDIKGMSCSSCVAHVEKAVSKLEGIQALNVNLLTNSMSVRYDENDITASKIEDVVKDAGYEAVVRKKKELTENITQQNSTVKAETTYDSDLLEMKKRWQVSIVMLIPLLYIAMGPMVGIPVPSFLKGTENSINSALIQMFIALPIFIINKKYFTHGFRSLIKRAPNMDSLIALGSSAAFIYGLFAISRISYGISTGDFSLVTKYSHDIYFESGATILTLVTLGKYFEAKSKSRTSEALTKLINLAPQTALVIRDSKEVEISINEVKVGDIIIIKSGQTIPVDGEVISGSASIDESALTGESIPVYKELGDTLMSATICQTGYLTFKATKVGEDTTLSQIIRLVEEASASKAPISKLADKISGIFVPIVITIAILASAVWLLMGYPFEFALSIGISVLVISCPCALGLATPVAIMVGTGKAATNGILIKSAEALEIGQKIDTVVLDKTGTLTEGKPSVTKITSNRFMPANKLLEIAASLEKPSEHPLAKAVLDEAEFRNVEPQPVSDFKVFPGMGIQATLNDRVYLAGNALLMQNNNINLGMFEEEELILSNDGNTVLLIANQKEVIGLIAVTDVLKSDSVSAVSKMHQLKLDVVMLTGDQLRVAEHLQHKTGINQVIAGVLPQGKEEEIRKLQSQGRTVAMVGDGINDSPALMRADLGIAIGAGSDIAIESADVVLVKSNLTSVITFIKLSKQVVRNIKQNLFWAFFYNVLGIPLAAGVFYHTLGWKLSPMFAAAAMSISSVTVVLNALRIKYDKK
ncbi:MAG: copper-translocating P-type ATPase [Bacteroidales bacterium 36-12]|nr:MAG: copper-translocating P-type ATPase [Bacteroidales bacterium 36-12]